MLNMIKILRIDDNYEPLLPMIIGFNLILILYVRDTSFCSFVVSQFMIIWGNVVSED